MSLLDRIATPADLKTIDRNDLPELCEDVRTYFIETILRNGGHFSANLGVVELTVALHYSFDLQHDKLVWDVGHQAYIHKLITGRKEQFETLRRWGGLSGFPKMDESEYDHFGTGHSSTSISAIMGMAEAAKSKGEQNHHIAVIGDGSLSGGMAFEALNNLGMTDTRVLVIVNDNEMGIDPNLGAINQHLSRIESFDQNLFNALNLNYTGPIDGHDTEALLNFFEAYKQMKGPQVLHIKTVKGKGYEPAEREQTEYHSVSYVKIDPKKKTVDNELLKFQHVFGETLVDLARSDERVVGVTPAMPSGSSMKMLMDIMPERVFDVGIAEQHAVTFAAGLALGGKRPFCHLYSSFAQRAYDQVIHDVALQNIPVIFCIDRAGIVGEDGPTHHGMFDLAFFNAIPNLTIMAPSDEAELRASMHWAVNYLDGPVVIRYPRGRARKAIHSDSPALELGKGRSLQHGDRIAVLSMGVTSVDVHDAIEGQPWSSSVEHIDMRFMKPLDINILNRCFDQFETIITIEDGNRVGGFGQQVKALGMDARFSGSIISLAYPDEFIPHGDTSTLKKEYGMDSDAIRSVIEEQI